MEFFRFSDLGRHRAQSTNLMNFVSRYFKSHQYVVSLLQRMRASSSSSVAAAVGPRVCRQSGPCGAVRCGSFDVYASAVWQAYLFFWGLSKAWVKSALGLTAALAAVPARRFNFFKKKLPHPFSPRCTRSCEQMDSSLFCFHSLPSVL